jgi:hypothetical protein
MLLNLLIVAKAQVVPKLRQVDSLVILVSPYVSRLNLWSRRLVCRKQRLLTCLRTAICSLQTANCLKRLILPHKPIIRQDPNGKTPFLDQKTFRSFAVPTKDRRP